MGLVVSVWLLIRESGLQNWVAVPVAEELVVVQNSYSTPGSPMVNIQKFHFQQYNIWRCVVSLVKYRAGSNLASPTMIRGPCRVGWSDLSLFFEFWSVHLTVDQVYFYEFNSKKSPISAARARVICAAKFTLQKITGPLNINIFLWNFAGTFLILQRTIAKNKIKFF